MSYGMAYDYMASFYDDLIQDIDTDTWFEGLNKILSGRDIKRVLEIGAGTGRMTAKLLEAGYEVCAIDISSGMLAALDANLQGFGRKLKLYNCDILDYEGEGGFDAAFMFLDVINYIEPENLKASIEKVHSLLRDKGFFGFDFSTEYKLKNILGNRVFVEQFEDFTYIWDNAYQEDKKRLDFDFTLFIRRPNSLFERRIEEHSQYAHSFEDVFIICDKRFDLVDVFADAYKVSKEGIKIDVHCKDFKEPLRWYMYFQKKS